MCVCPRARTWPTQYVEARVYVCRSGNANNLTGWQCFWSSHSSVSICHVRQIAVMRYSCCERCTQQQRGEGHYVRNVQALKDFLCNFYPPIHKLLLSVSGNAVIWGYRLDQQWHNISEKRSAQNLCFIYTHPKARIAPSPLYHMCLWINIQVFKRFREPIDLKWAGCFTFPLVVCRFYKSAPD